jgi:uncharacterized protein
VTAEPSICIGCGLCCDGTVVSHLAVSDESDLGAPLRALGVELIVVSDPPVFELPCPAVDHGVCTVFDHHRPRACAQFECTVLREHGTGVIDRSEALARIEALRRARNSGDGVTLESVLDRWFRS